MSVRCPQRVRYLAYGLASSASWPLARARARCSIPARPPGPALVERDLGNAELELELVLPESLAEAAAHVPTAAQEAYAEDAPKVWMAASGRNVSLGKRLLALLPCQHLTVDVGFEPEGVVVARIDLDARGYGETRGRVFYRQLRERVAALPSIESVGFAIYPPLSGNVLVQDVERADRSAGTGAGIVEAQYGIVDVGYFETLRIPIMAGRAFTPSDREGAPGVAVVNETLARRFWPGEDAVGNQIVYNGRSVQVVGVVGDGKYENLAESAVPPYVYVPMEQWYSSYMTLHARTQDDPGAALAAIRREVAALDPDIALLRANHLPSLIGSFLVPQRFAAVLIGTFGLIGLALAVVGLYGVLAYDVAQRTSELGLRMALGARAGDTLRLVLRQGLALVLGGLALGATTAAALTQFLSGFLLGLSPLDPTTFIVVALLLTGAALLASYLPARRATKVDPMTALRHE